MLGLRFIMKTRTPVELDELFERHYKDSGIDFRSFVSAWLDISTYLQVPPKIMRPDDDLIDLAGQAIIQPRMENLTEEAVERKQKLGRGVCFNKIEIVDDFIRQLELLPENRTLT